MKLQDNPQLHAPSVDNKKHVDEWLVNEVVGYLAEFQKVLLNTG